MSSASPGAGICAESDPGEGRWGQGVWSVFRSEPRKTVTVTIAGLTDVGESREHNEDGFLILDVGTGRELPDTTEEHSLHESPVILAVSDGMGGASAGEIASALSLQILQEHTASADPELMKASATDLEAWLAQGIQEANRRVREASQRDPSLRGMGATLTVAAVFPGTVVLAHVGDSRAYLQEKAGLRQLTTDHTFVGQMVAQGHITPEDARTHDHRHLLLQAVGAKDVLSVDTLTVVLEPGSRLLLCSDGLHDLVEAEEISRVLSSGTDPMAQCETMIRGALSGGSSDNITVIVLHTR